jgi:hypothetical protein
MSLHMAIEVSVAPLTLFTIDSFDLFTSVDQPALECCRGVDTLHIFSRNDRLLTTTSFHRFDPDLV